MKIIYHKGNLLDCTERFILQECNSSDQVEIDASAVLGKDARIGSTTIWVPYGDNKWMGCVRGLRGSHGTVSYDRLRGVMQLINRSVGDIIKEFENTSILPDGYTPLISVAMSKIGAESPSNHWDVMERIIETELTRIQPVVYYL